ncbi:MAG: anaerobic ribonucleoside-triphosphate reductase [Peptostreptococcaceae bacterium]
MIKVIKRDCSEVEFDRVKIENAILQAMKNGSGRVDGEIAENISKAIRLHLGYEQKTEVSIYEIEQMVFDCLCNEGHQDTARAYEGYRAIRELQRLENTIDGKVTGLVDGSNKETLTENANKRGELISTQAQLIYEEVSKDIALRKYYPPHIVMAHKEGVLHQHDLGHALTKNTNCNLINLKDMFEKGTVINGKLIETPNSLRTASNIATQIIAQIASNQHGGTTISIAHLSPYLRKSKEKLIQKYINRGFSDSDIDTYVKEDLYQEVVDSIQTINYQINTLQTSAGQAPFMSLVLFVGEEEGYEEETAMLIEEMLKQRITSIKNEIGVPVTYEFPKLLYVMSENNAYAGSEYFYLTELSAKCIAKRMMPDVLSEKNIRKMYKGQFVPPMGCRSFYTPFLQEDGTYLTYGGLNMGVCSINLADVGLTANKDFDKFWDILDSRLEMCYEAQRIRYKNCCELTSDSSPVHFQYGATCRLPKHTSIKSILDNGRATISLGYAGLYECVMAMLGVSHTSKDGKDFALKVMKYLNDKTAEWKQRDGLGWGVYGAPIEATTEKFALACRRRHGIIKGITDKYYVTNSYHVTPSEPIDAFEKLKFEAEFQQLSLGGAVSYIETCDLTKNPQAIITVMQYIYEHLQYAELNSKSDYCMECGYDGEILLEDETLDWYCPQCGNKDLLKMNIVRRVCGYLSSSIQNHGRKSDIKDRYIHL